MSAVVEASMNYCLYVFGSIVLSYYSSFFFFFQAEDGIRDVAVTGVQTCALPISQDPQDVVLGAGQFRGARQLLRLLPQGVGGLEHGEKDALFKGGGRVRRLAPEIGRASCRGRG